jgi:HD-like signal output (HDOD) protein
MTFIETPLPNAKAWVERFGQTELPVLARTANAIGKLRERIDDLAPRDISDVVIEDPLMTLRVLKWASGHLEKHMRFSRSNLGNDIETVEEAIVSTGIEPFFRQFVALETVEVRLAALPQARLGLLKVLSRSLVAAQFAREWAGYRNDGDIQVISEAAMLHDVAEILVWLYAPTLALRLQFMHQTYPNMRTRDFQKSILGVSLNELEVLIMNQWRLSNLLRKLVDDAHADTAQVRNVVLAANLARHMATSKDDAAIPDDLAGIADLLNTSAGWVRERIFPAPPEQTVLSVRSEEARACLPSG